MRSAWLAIALAALSGTAHAAPLDDVLRDRLAPLLPAGLGIAQLHVPANLPADVAPDAVSVEPPRELHAGRPSLRVTIRAHGKSTTAWVPVTLSALVDVAVASHALAAGATITEADITIEHRATEVAAVPPASVVGAIVSHELVAGAPIGVHDVALPPPLARGTQVTIDVHRGAVRVRGTGTLELAARPGEIATVRLAFNKTTLRGVLVAPATVVVGDL